MSDVFDAFLLKGGLQSRKNGRRGEGSRDDSVSVVSVCMEAWMDQYLRDGNMRQLS